MLTDEQIKVKETLITDRLSDYTGLSGTYLNEIMSEFRALQQQNKQMKETLDWIDEYRELNMTIAMNEWEEAAAFKAVENRVTDTIQSIQGGETND